MIYVLVSVQQDHEWSQSPQSCVLVQRPTSVDALCSNSANQPRLGCFDCSGCWLSPRTPSSPPLWEWLSLVSLVALFFFSDFLIYLAYLTSSLVYHVGCFLASLMIFFAVLLLSFLWLSSTIYHADVTKYLCSTLNTKKSGKKISQIHGIKKWIMIYAETALLLCLTPL